jgi:transglutaminase-like putative cysteine protease
MFYSVRHVTRFRYSNPVRQSVMELKMQPRSESHQALRNFQIATMPRAQLYAYTDHFGNAVYHFNVLREHSELRIEAQSVIEVSHVRVLPATTDSLEWERYNGLNLRAEHYDLLGPSTFACSSPELTRFAAAHELERPQGDTLSALKKLNTAIYSAFDYEVGVTQVHSPIEQALTAGRGVCQDFAHIMIAVARSWGVPARYVSGYLYHRRQDKDRSGEDATHAWVEAYLPSFGWIGFDPTNNIMAGERHIRVAVGRDYADVPPTRGTFKGDADSELGVAVAVEPTSAPVRHEEFLRVARPMSAAKENISPSEQHSFQQQQQQQ